VGNNHHRAPFPGEDFQMFEKDLPGQNTSGFSGEAEVGSLPMEMCETMNNSWGYSLTDNRYKSTEELIQYLVKAAGNNANFLLNVGPQPNGELPAASLRRMTEIGAWLRQYGPTVYGTRGGPVRQHDWGVTTVKDNKVYVHILKYDDSALFLPLIGMKVKKAVDFISRANLKFIQTDEGVLLTLNGIPVKPDYVVELEF